MNNQIIQVLDHLSDKLGLAVDWTAENIWPQVIEVMGKYRTYEILADIFQMLIALAMIGGFVFLFAHAAKADKNDDDGILCVIAIGLSVIVVPALTIWFCFVTADLARWIFIPEMQFIETIKSLLG